MADPLEKQITGSGSHDLATRRSITKNRGQQLCLLHAFLRLFYPRRVVLDDSVEDDEQFVHASGEGDFLEIAPMI